MIKADWAVSVREIFYPAGPTDVFDLIDQAFHGREDAFCLTDISTPDQPHSYTWRDVRARTTQIANAYQELGLEKGDGVFLLTRKSVPTVMAQLASFRNGTIFVPGLVLAPDATDDQKRSYLKDILNKRNTLVHGGALKDGGLLVIDPMLEPCLTDEVRSQFRQVLTFDYGGHGTLADVAAAQPTELCQPAVLGPGDGTYSVFTSGTSSGRGKCVLYSQENIMTSLKLLVDWLDIKAGTTALNALPINHIHGLMQQLLAVLAGGGRVLLMEKFDPRRFAHAMPDADLVSGVPAIWNPALDYLKSLGSETAKVLCAGTRLFTAGSDRISARLRRRFHDITGQRLVVRGGSTEQGHSYGNDTKNPNMDEGVGRPFRTYEMSLRDPNNPAREVAPGEVGELWMRGPGVVRGYIGNPEANAQAFPGGGWYRSGDLMRGDASATMTFVDRLRGDPDRSFIKSGSERVAHAEIELFFKDVPEFQDLRIVEVNEEKADIAGLVPENARRGYGERIAAVIVPNQGVSLEQAATAFLEICRKIPAAYLRPRLVAFVRDFSTFDGAAGSTLGKVNPERLRQDLEKRGTLPTLLSMEAVIYGGKPAQLEDLPVRSGGSYAHGDRVVHAPVM